MITLDGRRVLVTGGAGVIGRELLELLSASGAEVLSADRLPLPAAEPSGVRHLQTDLAVDDLEPIWAFRPQLIFHLAATFERSEESPDFWLPNWHDNVVVSHRLADGARSANGVEALVFASSYLIYDPRRYLSTRPSSSAAGLVEDGPIDPRNLCGAAKLYAEKEYLFAREHLAGAPRVVMARIFRVYGRGSRDVVSRWVRATLAGDPLTVFQPENRFDYVYARDVAEGLMRLGATPAAEGIVNLATGVDRSVADVIEEIGSAFPDAPPQVQAAAPIGPYEASRADVGRLRKLLDWVPATDLATGIGRIIDWERSAADGSV